MKKGENMENMEQPEVKIKKLKTGYVSGVVQVDLHEIIGLDVEGFLDLLIERLGKPLLMDINYKVVGRIRKSDTLKIRVTGDPSMEENCNESELGTG